MADYTPGMEQTSDPGQPPPPNSPIPAGMAMHGIVKPPNKEGPAGARVNNGNGPLTRGASTVHPANRTEHGDQRNGTHPLTGGASPVVPPNAELTLGMSAGHWPTPVQSGGHGSIPVQPFHAGTGNPKTALPVSEMGRAKK